MITLTGSELADLKTELDTSDIWNDVRVMLPSYETTLELLEDGWHRYPVDLVARATDGPSISKYGRRTKTQSKHVIEQYFAEAYCEGEVAKYRKPVSKVQLKVVGSTAANIITALTARLAGGVAYQYEQVNAIGAIDAVVFDVDLDGIPKLDLNVHELSAQDLLDCFNIDVDTVDSITDVIG